jgi:predicted kinase
MWKFPGHTDTPESLDWDGMTSRFDWVRDMIGVRQDAKHHAEGDVHTHTRMVVTELLKLPEYKALSEKERCILFAAACLHDVEKRSTTVETDGRITANGHARKGEYTARTILYKEVDTPFEIREEICALVRYHGLPIWLMERDEPERLVANCSLACNTHLLYILSKADMTGRICHDQNDMLERVEFFKAFCEDQECYGKKKEFASTLGRYKYLNEGGYADFVPFDDKKFEAILMSGLPGSGKDYVIKHIIQNKNVISLDDLRRSRKIKRGDSQGNGQVIQDAKEMARGFMRRRESFVWNGTNLTKDMRSALISLFMEYGAYVHIWYVETPYKKLLQQNNDREYKVHEAGVEKLIKKLDMPSPKECHEITTVIERVETSNKILRRKSITGNEL